MTDKAEKDGAIDTRLRVLSWNIWWRFGPWETRRAAISATLATIDADIIALQEVWGDETTNYAAALAAESGFHHIFAPSREINGFKIGNALMSRWPILQTDSTLLYSNQKTHEAPVAVFAEIDGPQGRLPLFCTHLNWRFQHSHARQRQVADLAGFVDRHCIETYPPILCGDFNATPMSEEIRMLTGLTAVPVEDLVFFDAWDCAGGGGAGYTWDNANPYAHDEFEPNRRIDYILVGKPQDRGAGQVMECRVTGDQAVDGVWPSDHYAVLGDLRY